jgi:DNA invertase Pin-like site-specific DNA recombinase
MGTDTRPVCYGYGRHSTAKQEFTRAAQRAKVKAYWRQHLKPKDVRWGGFYYDKAVQGSVEFSEREQGRQVYALARPGDHVVVSRLDRPFRSVYDGVKVIQSLGERKVRFHSLDLLVDSGTPMGKFFVTILLAVAELERAFASERTSEIIAYRKKHGLPVGHRPPLGWKIVGTRAKDNGIKRSTRRFVVDQEERELVEMIYELRQQGMAIEQIALWLMRQDEYPCKRRLDNYKAVEWAVAAKELGFPKQTDGKRMVKEWRASRPPNAPSVSASTTRVIKR